MLDFITNPDYARQEIEEAIRFRRLWTDISRELIRRTAGPYFRTDWVDGQDHHENLNHEFVVNFVPSMIDSHPKVEIESALLDNSHIAIQAMNSGENGWIIQSRMARTLKLIANDMPYDFGCALVTMEDIPGYDDDSEDNTDRWDLPAIMVQGRPMWPKLNRVSPRRVFRDPQGDASNSRYDGHMWVRDKEDLLKAKNTDGSPKFDREAVNSLTEDAGLEELDKDMDGSATMRQGPSRHQVVGYEWYCPETGLIYTLGYCPTTNGDGRHAFIRKPRPFFGIRRGPYVFFGISIIPDQLYPLSPLAVTAKLVQEIEAHQGQASDDAASAKRLVIVDGNSKTLKEGIRSYENGTVLTVPGFNGQFAQVEFGGAQTANLDHIERLLQRWERLTGINDTIRGNITGATATETNLAQQAGDIRTRFARSQFQDSVVDVLEAVAYLLHECPLCRYPVKVRDPVTGQAMTKIFVGGPQPGMEYVRFEDLLLRLMPYSMEYVDEGVKQRRMMMASDTAIKIVQAAVAMPALKPRELLDDLFEAFNIKDGGNRYVDYQALEMMRGMNMANQQAQTLAATAGAAGEVAGAGGGPPDAGGGAAGQPGEVGANDPMTEYAAMLAEAAG